MTTTRGSTGSARAGDADAGNPVSTGADVGELSYASAGQELDTIIEEFETGVVDVDRLVDQLERATQIVDELDRRLRRTRLRVEELVPRLEAVGRGELPDDRLPGESDSESDDGSDSEIEDRLEGANDVDPDQGIGPIDEEPSPGLF